MAFKNGSYRLKDWDYSSAGLYFITICTKDREHFFGKIKNEIMILNEFGKIAKINWDSIETQFENIKTADFVIMPNHLHGILVIDGFLYVNAVDESRRAINPAPPNVDIFAEISFNERLNSKRGGITGTKNPMLYRNISTAIRWFKGKTTFDSRKINKDFAWQPRFYDHIIRNERSFIKIQEYIEKNPKMWDSDRNNQMGIRM